MKGQRWGNPASELHFSLVFRLKFFFSEKLISEPTEGALTLRTTGEEGGRGQTA